MRAILWALSAALVFASPVAFAQLSLGGNNSDQPIEIASDTLEVQQDNQLAIFRGKVDVIQGDTRLRSDELFVHYREREARQQGGQSRQATSTSAASGPDASSITKIEAKGNVFVSTPQETAQGSFGVYDVDKKTVTLTGDVLLTNDRGTVRCAKVVMHQDTERSLCEPLPGGRVRGVILPNTTEQSPAPRPAPPTGNNAEGRR